MDLFLQIAFSLPTAVYSFLLIVVVGYWLIAILGIADLDFLDGLLLPDGDGLEVNGLAGLLLKVGLGGIPLTVIFSVLVMFGWIISYYTDYLFIRHLPFEWLRLLTGIVAVIAVFIAAVPLTSLILRPVRNLLQRVEPPSKKTILGRLAIVRSATVSATQGYGNVEDGGAGLILQIRAAEREFARGDRVILIEYLSPENAYRVISEDEFNGLSRN